MKKHPEFKSGQIMIIVLLIAGIIMTLGMALSVATLNDQKSQNNLSDSTVAYYAAESGAELAILGHLGSNFSSPEISLGSAKYRYVVQFDGSNNIIISYGTKGKVTRTIRVVVPNPVGSGVVWPSSWSEVAPTTHL